MDGERFDTLTRSLGAPASRRTALGTALAGGLLTAFGLARTVPEARAAQGGVCTFAVSANVRLGPSLSQPLSAEGQPGALRGNLSFALDQSGRITNGELQASSGERFPVVGQATGHSLQARIEMGPRLALVVAGVGEQEIARCQGAIDGTLSGPQVGDLGDWHATAGQQARSGGQSGSGSGSSTTTGETAPGSGRNATRSGRNNAGSQGTRQDGSPASSTSSAGQASGTTAESCRGGRTFCAREEGYCADLLTDPLNCGECGAVCLGSTPVCQQGRCLSEEEADSRGSTGLECDPNETICDGRCVYLPTDPSNCGACGRACDFNVASCQDGNCVFRPGETCPAGQIQCGANCCDACPSGTVNCGSDPPLCVDTLTDPTNCGLCGTVCEGGAACQRGECIVAGGGGCKDGSLTYCGEVAGCVDVNTDPANCSGCGIACAAGETCQGGACIATTTEAPPPLTCADQGLIDCFGVCVDLQTDPSNCGYCGEVCPSGQCDTGLCFEVVGPAPAQVGCSDGQADCGAGCIDVISDPANCGFCGNVCAGDQQCFLGGCVGALEIPI